jgi:DNA primase
MIEKKIKELQVSCVDIVKPLPFGMGYKMLKDVDSCIFATEGHPDALAIPTNVKECNSTYFMAIPGVNGIAGNQEVLGLLKGRIVYICFDQDKAGQDGAEKFAKMLQAAGAIPIIKLWDQKLGDDINNLRINGNIGKVF